MATALIVIDVQESFRQQPSWEQISDPEVVIRVAELVESARVRGDRVIWVLHSAPGSEGPFDPERGLVRLVADLVPRTDEPMIVKTSHNAFTTTNLGQMLTHFGIDTVRIAGIRTEQCVETTARVASDLGYSVEVVIDATATHPLPLADGSGMLDAAAVIERTAAALSGRFALVTTLAELGVPA